MKRSYVFALAVFGLGACDDSTTKDGPAPQSKVARAVVAAPAPQSLPRMASTVEVSEPDDDAPEAALDPMNVLDDEERRLLEADDDTLTKQERFARADAQRKLIMADPEHPLHPVLDDVERRVQSGEYAQMSRDMYSGRAAFPDRDEP